jgi:hypothetical protein
MNERTRLHWDTSPGTGSTVGHSGLEDTLEITGTRADGESTGIENIA